MTNVGAPLGPAPQGHGGRRHTRFAKLRRLLHRKPDPVDIETALTANTVIHLTTTFGECSLFVRVFGATGLFAADSNGFSDPVSAIVVLFWGGIYAFMTPTPVCLR